MGREATSELALFPNCNLVCRECLRVFESVGECTKRAEGHTNGSIASSVCSYDSALETLRPVPYSHTARRALIASSPHLPLPPPPPPTMGYLTNPTPPSKQHVPDPLSSILESPTASLLLGAGSTTALFTAYWMWARYVKRVPNSDMLGPGRMGGRSMRGVVTR